jgi:hypothetical protein
VLTSSDDSGVVVMVSRPSAVPNEPWRANCELRVFHLSLASPTGHWGPRSGNSALPYTVRARYGPVLTSSDDSGVVVMVSRPSAVTRSYACLGQRVLVVLELLLTNEGCSRCSFEGASPPSS